MRYVQSKSHVLLIVVAVLEVHELVITHYNHHIIIIKSERALGLLFLYGIRKTTEHVQQQQRTILCSILLQGQ